MARARLQILSAQHMTGHSRMDKDLGYSILSDALPIGNPRCSKKGCPSYMLCDICLTVYGVETKETARHVFYECRHTRLLLDVIVRALNEATEPDAHHRNKARAFDSATLISEALRVLVAGCYTPVVLEGKPPPIYASVL